MHFMSVLTTKQTGVAGMSVVMCPVSVALHCRILTIDMQATIVTGEWEGVNCQRIRERGLVLGVSWRGQFTQKYDLNVIPFSCGKVADICPYDFPFLCNPGAASPARGQSSRVQYRNDPTKVGRTALLASSGEAHARGP